MLITLHALSVYGIIGVPFVYIFALRKFDFKGRGSVTPKNKGRSKKIQGRTGLKNGGGSLAVGSYLQRGSAPPPSRGQGLGTGGERPTQVTARLEWPSPRRH